MGCLRFNGKADLREWLSHRSAQRYFPKSKL